MTDRREPQFGYRQDVRAEPSHAPASVKRRRGLFVPVLLGGVMVILAAGMFVIFRAHRPAPGQIPVIAADQSPVKVKPDQPGGAGVPFQDTTVYDELAAGRKNHADSQVEHLLQPPEQPLPKPEAPASPPPPAPNDHAANAAPDNPAALAPSLPLPPAASASAPPAASAEDETAAPEDEAAQPLPPSPKTHAKPPKPAPPPAVTPSAPAGSYAIQLGAFRDETTANSDWQRLKKLYPDPLAAMAPIVEKVDLGAKGVWYRLKAGPMDETAAKQACATLKAANAACIVAAK